MGGFVVQSMWIYKIFWPWMCYNSSYLLNYCMFNDSYRFSNKMHIRLSHLCPSICLFHLQKLLKYNVFEEVCVLHISHILPITSNDHSKHVSFSSTVCQDDMLLLHICLFNCIYNHTETSQSCEFKKKKKTFSFTANGTYNNKERDTHRKKGEKKERGNVSECSMVFWGVLEEWCRILQE